MKERMSSLLLGISLILVSCGQLVRISVPGYPIYFYLFEPLIAVLTITLLYGRRQNIRASVLFKPMLFFLGFMLVSLTFSFFSYHIQENGIALLYFIRLSMYVVFLYIFLQKEKQATKHSTRILIGITIWIIFSSFVQYFLYPNLGNLAYQGWDPHLYRVVGLFFDPPITVAVFVLLAIHFVFKMFEEKNRKYFFLIIPLLVLSFLTYSRGGFVGVIGIATVFIVRNRNVKVFFMGAIILILGVFLIPKGESEGINLLRTTSISSRVYDYEKALIIFQKNPVTGIGYNHIRPEKDPYETQMYTGSFNPSHGSASFHSSFLIILVTGGIIGFALWIYFLIVVARTSSFMMYSIVFLSILSLFDNVLLHPMILVLLGYIGSLHVRR